MGTLKRRANEVAETLERREIDVCCVQEVGWRGEGARHIDGRSKQFKLFWTGNSSGHGEVGVMVADKWIDKVIAVNRVNDRLMSVKLLVGKTIMAIHSTYAPQQGLPKECKEEYYSVLNKYLRTQDENALTFIGGDMNGHVGRDQEGYTAAHGGYGYGTRNL